MDKLVKRVEKWAEEKGILSSGTPERQLIKSLEELHETMEATYEGDFNEMVDGCGDTLVTLIIYARLIDSSAYECLEAALNVIEKRTGKMVKGTFVKSTEGE